MFLPQESWSDAFLYFCTAYCLTYLVTRLHWPLPQSEDSKSKTAYNHTIISWEQSDFCLLPLLWGHPTGAPQHSTRYAQRAKAAEAGVQASHQSGPSIPEKGIAAIVQTSRLPTRREWAILAAVAVSLVLLV